MKRVKATMNTINMINATNIARSKIFDTIQRAKDIEHDSRANERLLACLCKACFYFPTIAGAAITDRPCMCCEKTVTYSNTNTDKLCMDCAEKHDLCKHCGGDLYMRTNRKNWPKP